MEKISVIIPVYNVEKYLKRCLDSVITQTYENMEIILIDDGSMDSSGAICDRYAKKDERIRVIHKENGGLSDARNAGVKIASGEYITYIDSDDYIEPDNLQTLYQNLKQTGADVSIGALQYVYENDKVKKKERKKFQISVWSAEETLHNMLLQQKITTSVCGVLSKKEYWEKVRFPKGKICEDMGTSYKIYSQAKKIVYTEKIIYYYYMRLGSIQNGGFSKSKMDELEMVSECKRFLDLRYPRLKEATTNRLISVCFHILFFMDDFKEEPLASKKLVSIIKKQRLRMILGRDVNKKVRFGCLCTYLGFGFTKWVYNRLAMRGVINL